MTPLQRRTEIGQADLEAEFAEMDGWNAEYRGKPAARGSGAELG